MCCGIRRKHAIRLIGAANGRVCLGSGPSISGSGSAQAVKAPNGQEIFRYDTFGDEQLWTDVLGLHEAVQAISPFTALSVGLKVDADALLPPIVKALETGQLNVNDPSSRSGGLASTTRGTMRSTT